MGPPAQLNYFHHTLNGFNRGLSEYGVNGYLNGTVDKDSPVTEIVAAARRLAELREPPDAIVCVSSSVALAMIAGLKQGGLEIGRDYDLVAKPVTQTLIASQPAVIAI
ncbi:MAG: substrate-binding domain-containing protein [Hyphomicrobiales bacterium]